MKIIDPVEINLNAEELLNKKFDELGVEIDKPISFQFGGETFHDATVRGYVDLLKSIDEKGNDGLLPLSLFYILIKDFKKPNGIYDLVIYHKLQQLEKAITDLHPDVGENIILKEDKNV